MKNNNIKLILFHICFVLIVFSIPAQAQIEVMGCFDSNGNLIPKYQSWDEIYNGVKYRCTCNGDGTTDCVQESSSSSSSSNNNSSGNDLNGQIMESLVAPLIQNFFDWLFEPSSPPQENQGNQLSTEDLARIQAENEENERKAAEYRAKMKEQIEKLNKEYVQLMKDKFEDKKQSTVSDFKNKIAKSEAIKNIKQLNCASFQSYEALKMISQDNGDFSDLNGPLENSRQLAEFTITSNCPEIKIDVPEVTVSNPKGFQEIFFETIKRKADSMTVSVVLLKEKDKKIKIDIAEKEKIVEKLKTVEPTKVDSVDQLMIDAINALNESREEENKVTEELSKSEKDIELFGKVRSVYDVKKPE